MPPGLLATSEARTWWRSLSSDERTELLHNQTRSPLVLLGEVEPAERAADRADLALADTQLLDFVLTSDVPFFLEERRFHICRAHPPARRVLSRGARPPLSRCPHRGPACPWSLLGAPELRLRLLLDVQ